VAAEVAAVVVVVLLLVLLLLLAPPSTPLVNTRATLPSERVRWSRAMAWGRPMAARLSRKLKSLEPKKRMG